MGTTPGLGFWRAKKAQLKAERGSNVPRAACRDSNIAPQGGQIEGTVPPSQPVLATLPRHSVVLAGTWGHLSLLHRDSKLLQHTTSSQEGKTNSELQNQI